MSGKPSQENLPPKPPNKIKPAPKDILLNVLQQHFGVMSRLDPAYPRHVIIYRGDDEFVVPLNLPKLDTFAPLAIRRIIDRFEDVDEDTLMGKVESFSRPRAKR